MENELHYELNSSPAVSFKKIWIGANCIVEPKPASQISLQGIIEAQKLLIAGVLF